MRKPKKTKQPVSVVTRKPKKGKNKKINKGRGATDFPVGTRY